MDDTLSLCIELRDAGYNPEAKANPEAWNAGCENLPQEEKDKGFYWSQHPTLGWYPNLGRRAYVEELKKVLGEEAFKEKYGEDTAELHRSRSHEVWCRDLIDAIKAQPKETHD